jgi:hypothetical protein
LRQWLATHQAKVGRNPAAATTGIPSFAPLLSPLLSPSPSPSPPGTATRDCEASSLLLGKRGMVFEKEDGWWILRRQVIFDGKHFYSDAYSRALVSQRYPY